MATTFATFSFAPLVNEAITEAREPATRRPNPRRHKAATRPSQNLFRESARTWRSATCAAELGLGSNSFPRGHHQPPTIHRAGLATPNQQPPRNRTAAKPLDSQALCRKAGRSRAESIDLERTCGFQREFFNFSRSEIFDENPSDSQGCHTLQRFVTRSKADRVADTTCCGCRCRQRQPRRAC